MLPEAGWPLAATGEHLPSNATMSSGFDARRFFSYLFIFAIALVFILQFGPGSRGCNAPLTPHGEGRGGQGQWPGYLPDRVPPGLRPAARRPPDAGRRDLPEALARQFGIPGRVLDELITTELLEQAAEAHGITVSDTDLLDSIRKDPSFQKDGQFDPETYTQVLQTYAPEDAPGLRGRAPPPPRRRAPARAGGRHRGGLRGRAPRPLPARGGHGQPLAGQVRPGRLRREDQAAHPGRGDRLGEGATARRLPPTTRPTSAPTPRGSRSGSGTSWSG